MIEMNILKITAQIFYRLAKALDKSDSNKNIMPDCIKIHPTSTINIDRISLKDNCRISIGEQSQIIGSLIFDRENASIKIGSRVFMNGTLIAAQSVELGDDILMAWGITVVDHNSHSVSFSKRADDVVNWQAGVKDWTYVKSAPVVISNKVWIGFNSIILKGVTIGEGAVIAAGSVVTKDVPPWSIMAGNPARVVREIPENER